MLNWPLQEHQTCCAKSFFKRERVRERRGFLLVFRPLKYVWSIARVDNKGPPLIFFPFLRAWSTRRAHIKLPVLLLMRSTGATLKELLFKVGRLQWKKIPFVSLLLFPPQSTGYFLFPSLFPPSYLVVNLGFVDSGRTKKILWGDFWPLNFFSAAFQTLKAICN